MEIDAEVSITESLRKLVGSKKPVVVYLRSGMTIQGKVAQCTKGHLVLAELPGGDFFDAIVEVSEVVGFEMQVR